MNLLEFIFCIFIISIISAMAFKNSYFINENNRATLSVLNNLSRARIMGLVDQSHVGNIDFADSYELARTDKERLLEEFKYFYWQLQFHLSGTYTFNALSIYRDTPRFANATDFDARPMSGDIVALNVSNSKCLSGYNNTNIADFCKNNASIFVRFFESMKLKNITLLNNLHCMKRDTFRFYFDSFGRAHCDFSNNAMQDVTKILIGDKIINIVNKTGYAFLQK